MVSYVPECVASRIAVCLLDKAVFFFFTSVRTLKDTCFHALQKYLVGVQIGF